MRYWVILLVVLTSCFPSKERCYYLYPPVTTVAIDTVKEEKYVVIKGDTITLQEDVIIPCPDSIEAWGKFTSQLNAALNRSDKLIQKIKIEKNKLEYSLKIKSDSVKYYQQTINQLTTKEQPPLIITKTPNWAWYCLVVCILLIFIILKKFS